MADSSTLVDRVKMFVESSGTGPFQLGNAVPAFRGSEALTDGLTYSYAVESGSDYEVGQGVYVSAVDQLLRAPTLSSANGAPVNFPANVTINFTALAADLVAGLAGSGTVTSVQGSGGTTGLTLTGGPITGAGTLTLGGVLGVANGGTAGTTEEEAREGIGLGNVDNTSDADKPISTATQTALDAKVSLTALAEDDGAALVGFQQSGSGTRLSSGAQQFAQRVSINDFTGADPTGTTSSTAAAASAATLLAARSGGLAYFQAGTYLSAMTLGDSQNWKGEGPTSEISIAAPSTIKKNANGPVVLVDGYTTSLSEVGIVGNSANFTGHGVHVLKARFRASGVSVSDSAGNAFQLNPGAGINGNAWRLGSIYSNSAKGSGIYIDHTGNAPTGSFPLGPPDINAGYADHAVILSSAQYGVYGGNSIDNVFVAPVIQNCGREGVFLDEGAQGYKIFAPYLEANGSDASGLELVVKAGSTQHIIMGNRYCLPGAGDKYRDENAPGKNYIITYSDGIGRFAQWGEMAVWNRDYTATGEVHFKAFLGADGVNTFNHVGTISGGTGGTWGVETKRNGNTPLRRFSIDHLGNGYAQNSGTWTFGKAAADTPTPGLTIYADGTPRLDFVGSGSSATTLTAHYNANGFVGGISMSGSATAYATSSDRRLKKKIEPLTGALELVVQLRPVTFEFKKDKSGDRHQGFIADELQQLLPLAVIGDADGEIQLGRIVVNDENDKGEAIKGAGTIVMDDVPEPAQLPDDTHFEPTRIGKWYQSVDLAKLVPALTGALQELARRDEAKDTVIAELTKRLTALEKRG